MGPMEESWQNYERQRRRLNARLGLMVFALLPLPAILMAVGLSPLRMLLVVASLGVEYRDSVSDVVEDEAQSTSCFGVRKGVRGGSPGFAGQVGLSCGHRSNVVLVGWQPKAAEWVGLAFGVAAVLLLCCSHFSDKKAERKLLAARRTP